MRVNSFFCFSKSGAGCTSASGSRVTATFYSSTSSLFFFPPSLFIGRKPVRVSQIKCLGYCQGCRLGLYFKILGLLLVCYQIRSNLCIAVILNWLFYDDPNQAKYLVLILLNFSKNKYQVLISQSGIVGGSNNFKVELTIFLFLHRKAWHSIVLFELVAIKLKM